MPNRVTGMYSGLDTETLIKDLIKAKSKKVETIKKDKTKAEWKSDAWKDLNNKVKTFFSKQVSNLRWSTTLSKKATSVSNKDAVSVITGEKAMDSVQNLSIKELASSGYLTGGKVTSANGSAKGSDFLNTLKFNNQAFSGVGSFDVTVNGKTKTITVDSTFTIDNIVSQLNSAGVSANFDEKNQRIFIGASGSGKDADFVITANNEAGQKALSALGINASPSLAATAEYTRIAAYSSQYFTGSSVSDWISALQADTTSEAYNYFINVAKGQDNFKLEEMNMELERLKAEEEPDEDAIAEKEAEIEAFKVNFNAGVYTTEAMEFAAKDLKQTAQYAQTALSLPSTAYNTDALKLEGKDAVIELNGVRFTSATNSVEVNGLTFECKAKADNITVTTQNDTDGIYDVIKNFLKEYNSLINSIDEAYYAVPTKLQPLTDEEKDAVSEKEAEKIENEIKKQILRRDEQLGDLFNGIREVMADKIVIDGEELYLSSFGIETPNYLTTVDGQRNAYHIAGDPDDETSSQSADKLKSMIATDPNKVIDFFTQLGRNLYAKMNDMSAQSEDRSFGSYYDDKAMKKDLSDWETRIKEAEDKLTREEDKLYDKFTAMEVALSKLQSSTSYISSLFGGGN